MTISTTTQKEQFNGNGSTTSFPTSIPAFVDSDYVVVLTNTTSSTLDGIAAGADETQTLTTDYTVSGLPTDGTAGNGTIDFVSAPSTDIRITVRRVLPLKQETDYIENDPFPASSHEEALDRAIMITQQFDERLDRSVQLSEGTTLNELLMPDPEADKFIRWNSAASGLENAEITDVGTAAFEDDAAQQPNTNGSAGTNSEIARGDHVHPLPAVAAGLLRTSDQLAPDIASVAEAAAGTASDKLMTPERVRDATLNAAPSELTISSGSVTPTGLKHTIDTESDASSDDLEVMPATNLSNGAQLLLRAENAGRTVVVKHNTDTGGTGDPKIFTTDDADFSLDDDEKSIILELRGSAWHEIARSEVGGGGIQEQQVFNSSGTWNKPSAGTIALIECWGGGGSGAETSRAGGGGGGAYNATWAPLSDLGSSETVTIGAGGAAVNSGNGNVGGDTTFGSLVTAFGGGGGTTGVPGIGGGGGGAYAAGSTGGAGAGPGGGASGSPADDAASGYGGGGGGSDADGGRGWFGGGGGAGGVGGGAAEVGGDSYMGGAGGGGDGGGAGGTSNFGGDGGTFGGTVDGQQPGGGGAGTPNGTTSGAGGNGRVTVTVW